MDRDGAEKYEALNETAMEFSNMAYAPYSSHLQLQVDKCAEECADNLEWFLQNHMLVLY